MARKRPRIPDEGELYEPAQSGDYRLQVHSADGGEGDAYRVRMRLQGPREGYWWTIACTLAQADLDRALAEQSDAGDVAHDRIASAMAELVVEWVIEAIEEAELPRTDYIDWRVAGDDIDRILRRARGGLEIEMHSNYTIECEARRR